MKKLSLLALICIFSVFCILCVQPLQAQSNQEKTAMFDLVGTPRTQSLSSAASVREQEIIINFETTDFAAARMLNFPLLDGKSYSAIQSESKGFERFSDDEYTWRGKISGEKNFSGDVILTVKNKALSGLIYSPTAVYEIIPQANFTHLLVELDQSRFPDCGNDAVKKKNQAEKEKNDPFAPENSFDFTRPVSVLFGNEQSIEPTAENSLDGVLADDGTQIDVLVVYTAAVRNALGGTAQAQAFAQQSVASANTAYQNSGITPRLRLVQTLEVSYAETGTVDAALTWVKNDAGVAAARNTAKADLVSILVEGGSDYCGIASYMSTVSVNFASQSFSAVARSCAVGNLSFAHELAHNQAADHNPEDAAGTHPYAYTYGHWNATGNFRTVMSYANPCPSCIRVPYFSNPAVLYNGFATGISGQRENARVLNNTALVVSQFRDSGGGGGGSCTVTPIAFGQTISRTLDTDCVFTGTTRNVDAYSFTGTAGQRIAVAMNSTAFDTYLYLLNPGNTTIAEDNNGGGGTNSRIPATSGYFTLPAAGSYSIYATSNGSNLAGAYTISLTAETSCSYSISPTGQSVAASGGNGSTTVTTTAGCTWTAVSNATSWLTVTSGASGSGSGTVGFSAQANTTGAARTGTITIAGQTFTVSQPTGSSGGCSVVPIAFGQTINGSLANCVYTGTTRYVDPYTFSGTAGQRIAVSMNSAVFDTYLYLVSPSNQILLENDDSGGTTNSRIPVDSGFFTLPATGTYTIQATAYYSNATGAYSISLTQSSGSTVHNRKTAGVFRPSNGITYMRNSNTGGVADISMIYGVAGDQSFAGDWNGDGVDSIGIYRNGVFYLRNSNTTGPADIVFAFGAPGDQPVAGDWDGNGIDTIGVYRPTTGVFMLRNSNTAGAPEIIFVLGNPGDVAIAGDWNGDGITTTGVFRPTNGIVYLKNTNVSGVADIYLVYGVAGDKPLAGDWDGDGADSVGIYRNGLFYLRNSNTQGNADLVFALGNAGDEPIAGDWDGLP